MGETVPEVLRTQTEGTLSPNTSSVCPCEKTLQRAKKLFKVSLLSLSKDSLINCFWENLSFCQFILVFNRDLR